MFHFSNFELYFTLHLHVLSTFQQHLLQFPTIKLFNHNIIVNQADVCLRALINVHNITIPIFSLDVVRAYKNLLQEKEALEATVKVLTSGNTQPTKSSQRNEPSHSRDQKEVVKDEISSDKASKSGGLASPLEEDGFKKGEVLDHPLAVKDDEGNDESQLPSDKVWCDALLNTKTVDIVEGTLWLATRTWNILCSLPLGKSWDLHSEIF